MRDLDMTEEQSAFYRGLYSSNNNTERLIDELDHLLVNVDEDTATKIMQLAYKLADPLH